MGVAEALATDAGNRSRIAKTRDGSLPGVADSIEQQSVTEHEPGALADSCFSDLTEGEYAEATETRARQRIDGAGMEAGIAVKSGNADGAKASTVAVRGWTNIPHRQRWEKGWQET